MLSFFDSKSNRILANGHRFELSKLPFLLKLHADFFRADLGPCHCHARVLDRWLERERLFGLVPLVRYVAFSTFAWVLV